MPLALSLLALIAGVLLVIGADSVNPPAWATPHRMAWQRAIGVGVALGGIVAAVIFALARFI